MNFTLHQLQVYIKITQYESITKAAEALCLSQPAVSIQLKNFQEQFDIPLTEIIGRKLYVTDFGKEITLAAEKILNEVAAINYKTQLYKGQLSGRLRCTAVSTGKYVIPYYLSGFLAQHPNVELSIDVTNKAKVNESLVKNEVDFALVSIIPTALHVEKEDLISNILFLVANDAYSIPDKLNQKEVMEAMPMIYREAGSGTRSMMEQILEQSKVTVQKKLELTSNEAVKQAVIAGLGCSVLPLIGMKNELQQGSLKIIPADGFPMITNWSLIWLASKKMSPIAAAFLDYIRQEKAQIAHKYFGWQSQYH
jgi:DNA-binding transcriptional LysR family regulator